MAGKMRIKAKPQASQAESGLGLSLAIYKIKNSSGGIHETIKLHNTKVKISVLTIDE